MGEQEILRQECNQEIIRIESGAFFPAFLAPCFPAKDLNCLFPSKSITHCGASFASPFNDFKEE